jgi:hypothetical protein
VENSAALGLNFCSVCPTISVVIEMHARQARLDKWGFAASTLATISHHHLSSIRAISGTI